MFLEFIFTESAFVYDIRDRSLFIAWGAEDFGLNKVKFGRSPLWMFTSLKWSPLITFAIPPMPSFSKQTAATMTIMTSVCFYNIIIMNLHFSGIQDEGYFEWRHGRSHQLHLSYINLSPFISLQNNNTSTNFPIFLEKVWICRILIIVI